MEQFIEGLKYERLWKRDKAKQCFIEASKEGITNAFKHLGKICEIEGNYSEANRYYKIATDKYLNDIQNGVYCSMKDLADIYRWKANDVEAKNYYNQYIEKANISIQQLKTVGIELEDYDQKLSKKAYYKMIDLGDPDGYDLLCDIAFENKEYETGINYLIEGGFKGSGICYHSLTRYFETENKMDLAIEYAKKGINIKSNECARWLSNHYRSKKEYDQMELYALQCHQFGNKEILSQIGLYYRGIKEFEKMKKFYLKSIQDCNSEHSVLDLADHYDQVENNFQEAEKYYLMLNQEDYWNLMIIVKFYTNHQKDDKVKEYLEKAFENCDSAHKRSNLARYFTNLSTPDFIQAEKHILLTLQDDEYDPGLVHLLMVYYYEMGEYQKMEVLFPHIDMFPKSSLFIGDYFREMKMKEKAFGFYIKGFKYGLKSEKTDESFMRKSGILNEIIIRIIEYYTELKDYYNSFKYYDVYYERNGYSKQNAMMDLINQYWDRKDVEGLTEYANYFIDCNPEGSEAFYDYFFDSYRDNFNIHLDDTKVFIEDWINKMLDNGHQELKFYLFKYYMDNLDDSSRSFEYLFELLEDVNNKLVINLKETRLLGDLNDIDFVDSFGIYFQGVYDWYQKFVDRHQKVKYWGYFGVFCAKNEKLDEAVDLFQKCLDQGDLTAIEHFIYLYGGFYNSTYKNDVKFIEYCLIGIDYKIEKCMIALADYYFTNFDSENNEKAEKYYLMAVESYDKNNNDSYAYQKLAKIYKYRKNYEMMEHYYLQAIKLGHKSTLLTIAITYYEVEKYDQFYYYAKFAMEQGLNSAKLLDYLVNYCLDYLHDHQKARDYIDIGLTEYFPVENNIEKLLDYYFKYKLKEPAKDLLKIVKHNVNELEINFDNIVGKMTLQERVDYLGDLDRLVGIYKNRCLFFKKNLDEGCGVCLEKKDGIPLECSHYVCLDCYEHVVKMKKCHVCRREIYS